MPRRCLPEQRRKLGRLVDDAMRPFSTMASAFRSVARRSSSAVPIRPSVEWAAPLVVLWARPGGTLFLRKRFEERVGGAEYLPEGVVDHAVSLDPGLEPNGNVQPTVFFVRIGEQLFRLLRAAPEAGTGKEDQMGVMPRSRHVWRSTPSHSPNFARTRR